MEQDLQIITWALVLILLITIFTYLAVPTLTAKITLNDIRLGRLQALQPCQTNNDCNPLHYCQAYNAQGQPISQSPHAEFGACQPRMKITA